MKNDKLMECIGNPAMCKLLLEIQSRGQATAKQLSEIHPDIPQATLYRYLNRMLKDDILTVAAENKVRGILEKVYALQSDLPVSMDGQLAKRAGEDYLQTITQFMMGMMREFQEYVQRGDVDIQRDGAGFSSCPLYLSDEELAEIVNKMKSIIEPLQGNTPSANRKLRSFGFILTPPKEG